MATWNGLVYPQTPGPAVPDEIGYTALFYVVRSAPSPHWDEETCRGWLEQRGMASNEAVAIINAATSFYERHRLAEAALSQINRKYAGQLLSEAAEAERRTIRKEMSDQIATAVSKIQKRLNADGKSKFSRLIAEIKSTIKLQAR